MVRRPDTATTGGTQSVETPHEKQKKCPRRPAATITTLTAATGKVLTEFVGFRPTDLGHPKLDRGERSVNVVKSHRNRL